MDKKIILFKFATRSRPEKFIAGIENIVSKLSDKENFKILVTADKDDVTMYNRNVMTPIKPLIDAGKVVIIYGTSKSKIDAINRDMDLAGEWDILINFSDDMEFLVGGFDEVIRQLFAATFPNLDGNLHFNDGFTKDLVCAMSIMGKPWYDRFKYIYEPSYFSLFCDNEYTEVANKLGKMKYFDMIIFRHNHPANVGGVSDAQLKATEAFWDIDGANFKKRKEINFGL